MSYNPVLGAHRHSQGLNTLHHHPKKHSMKSTNSVKNESSIYASCGVKVIVVWSFWCISASACGKGRVISPEVTHSLTPSSTLLPESTILLLILPSEPTFCSSGKKTRGEREREREREREQWMNVCMHVYMTKNIAIKTSSVSLENARTPSYNNLHTI